MSTKPIVSWAVNYLMSSGYIINNPPETVQTTPWSSVTRFLTSNGYIYLKQTPPALSLEPDVTKILYDQFNANVPVIIAINKELHSFLMTDHGEPLRKFLKLNFQPDLLCQAIKIYSAIQIAAINHVDLFISIGVPDWRLNKLPDLYNSLILQEDLLITDGITSEELKILDKLRPTFLSICEQLAQYKIPETLDHCDFHDNNILFNKDTNKITIIDLGETVITHPFLSLISCLRNAYFRYNLKETDQTYINLQDACFENWLKFETKNNLLKIYDLAKILFYIYTTLGEYRLMIGSDPEQFKLLNRRGRMAIGLKEFIKYNIKP